MKFIAAFGCLLCLVCLHWLNPVFLDAGWHTPIDSFATHLRILLDAQPYRDAMRLSESEAHKSYALPKIKAIVGTNTVDVFAADLRLALFNGLHYTPRPVGQSYSAYNEETQILNENFYIQTPPAFVLVKVKMVDEHLVTMEDARVLRQLTINYRQIAEENGTVLLRRISSKPVVLLNAVSRHLKAGEVVTLTASRYWITATIHPGLWERLRGLLYQESPTSIVIGTLKFNAPRVTLSAGFMLTAVPIAFTQPCDICYAAIKSD